MRKVWPSLGILLCCGLIVSGCSSVSTQSEDPLAGQRTVAWFINKYGETSTHGLSELLTKVQARLRVATAVTVGRDPGALSLRVFNYREPLAFSTVGGEIVFSKGLLLSLESEDELAAVIAHELAHVILGHLKELKPQVGDKPELVMSEAREVEADRLSVTLMKASSYDPLATMAVLRRLTGGQEAREQALAEELAKFPPERPSTNLRLFKRVQAEIVGMDEPRRLRESSWQ